MFLPILGAVLFGVGLASVAVWKFHRFCPVVLIGVSDPATVCSILARNPPWLLLSGLVAGPPAMLTWYWRTIQKQADIWKGSEDIRVAVEAQMTDRYVRALELLAHDHASIRMGGVFALERLAKDSPKDLTTIVDVLAGFVRKSVPLPRKEEPSFGDQPVQPLPQDVLAALTVLMRRPRSEGSPMVNLTGTCLAGWTYALDEIRLVNFEDADLRLARFTGVGFHHVRLSGANLSGASFSFSSFEHTRIEHANLTHARMDDCTWTTEGLVETPIHVDGRTVVLTREGAALVLDGRPVSALVSDATSGPIVVAAQIATNGERGEICGPHDTDLTAKIAKAELPAAPTYRYGRVPRNPNEVNIA